MTLEDIRRAADCLASEAGRTVDVIDQGNGMVAVLVRDVPTSVEKGWRKTVDLIMNVNVDFPRTGFEQTGFYVIPPNFADGAASPQSCADATLPNVGPCKRFSWSPKNLPGGEDLRPFYRWMLGRLFMPGAT